MAAEPQDSSAVPPSDDPPGEVLLQDHVRALRVWRREILLATGVAALLGALLALILKPEYEATATVAIVRSGADSFDVDREGQVVADLVRRDVRDVPVPQRMALLGLVHHTSVARAVVEAVGDRLTEDERDLRKLLESISAPIALAIQQRNLISIQYTADTPEKAADVANAWAEAYVREVNSLYALIPTGGTAMAANLAQAQETYANAQRNLESFIAASEEEWLRQRILELQRNLRIRQVYRLLLVDAQSLLAQIKGGGEAAGASNAMAIMLLKSQVFSSSAWSEPRSTEEFSIAPSRPGHESLSIEIAPGAETDVAGQVADVETLIEMLRERLRQLDAPALSGDRPGSKVEEEPSESAVPGPPMSGLERNLQVLWARWSAVEATLRQLETERDLRRNVVAAMREADTELRLAHLIFTEEVRLASPAIPPEREIGVLRVGTGAAKGAVPGLLGSVLFALAANFLSVRPFFGQRL